MLKKGKNRLFTYLFFTWEMFSYLVGDVMVFYSGNLGTNNDSVRAQGLASRSKSNSLDLEAEY